MENTEFDLEWAKHGGCCIFDDSTDVYKQLILGKQVEERFIGARFFFGDHWVKFFCYFENYPTRMATPDECKAAGIEYIDPPIRWLQIDSAPEDGRIIEVADFRVVVANEGPLSKHWKFWRDIPHPLNKNSMTQPPKGE